MIPRVSSIACSLWLYEFGFYDSKSKLTRIAVKDTFQLVPAT